MKLLIVALVLLVSACTSTVEHPQDYVTHTERLNIGYEQAHRNLMDGFHNCVSTFDVDSAVYHDIRQGQVRLTKRELTYVMPLGTVVVKDAGPNVSELSIKVRPYWWHRGWISESMNQDATKVWPRWARGEVTCTV